CALGEPFSDRLGRLDVGAGLEAAAHVLFQRGGGRHRLSFRVVDHLRVDVLRRTENREPRAVTGGAGDIPPPPGHSPPRAINNCRHRALPSLLLSFLAEDVFARVLDAFALVRLGLAEATDYRGDVPDLLAIDAGNDNLGRLGHGDRDALRNRIHDVVAIAELDLQVLALQRGAVTDAVNLQPALEALGHARHHVGEQRTVGTPHGAGAFGVDPWIDLDLRVLHLGRDVAMEHDRHRALGPFHVDDLAVHAGGDARGDRNRLFSYTRH